MSKLNRESIWIQKNGTGIAIKDMSIGHMERSLDLIKRMSKASPWRKGYRQALEQELKLKRRINNSPLGKALT